MPTLAIAEFKVFREALQNFGKRAVRLQIDICIFHGSSETFDEHVAQPLSLAMHGDVDAMILEDSYKCI